MEFFECCLYPCQDHFYALYQLSYSPKTLLNNQMADHTGVDYAIHDIHQGIAGSP
jgi:hypothetical protein